MQSFRKRPLCPLSDMAWRLHEDSNLDCRFRRPDSILLNYAAGYWMRRRVPPPLMTVLQTAAFLFRHDALVGSPSRNRIEISRVRTGCSPIERAHDPEKWIPVSRLREALARSPSCGPDASARQVGKDYAQTKRAAIGQGAVFCPPASAVQARDSSCTSFTL
jgi:hypothetical protein